MENISLTERLAQAEDSEVGEAFNSFMHTAARAALVTLLFEEVESLCGKAYHPETSQECRRAGSAPGVSGGVKCIGLRRFEMSTGFSPFLRGLSALL